MQKKNHYIIILLFIFCSSLLHAQKQPVYWFQNQTGLPTTFIKDIEQDKDGNILFASYLGLIIYDGKTFETKTIKDGLPTTSVSALVKDGRGNVWIRSLSNKLSIYNNDTIIPVDSYNNYILNRTGYAVYPISNNELIVDYVLPFYSVTHQFNNGKWKQIVSNDSNEYRLPLRNPIDKSKICAYFYYKEYQSTKQIKFNFVNGVDFISTSEHFEEIISRLSIVDHEYFSVDNILFEFNTKGVIKQKEFDETIIQIIKGIDNTLWIIFKNGGIQKISQSNFNPLEEVFLKEYTFYNFHEDIDGGRWFSCSNGLGYLKPSNYKNYFIDKQIKSSINDGVAIGDTLLLGHSNGDVGYLVPARMEIEQIIFKHDSAKNAYVSNFVSDFALQDNGKVIFSNANSGIYEIDRKTLKVKKLAPYETSALYATNNEVYCALYNQGFLIIKNGIQEHIDASKVYGSRLSVESIFKNNKNEIILGCENGLFKYSNGKIFPASHRKELKDRIVQFKQFTSKVSGIFTCGSGMVLCSNNDTIVLDKSNGISSNCVGSICKDIAGNFWLVGVEGISKLKIDESNLKNYKIETILGAELGHYVNFSAVSIANEIYVLDKKIISVIDTRKPLHPQTNIPLKITSVQINGSKLNENNTSFLYNSGSELKINFRQINFIPDSKTSYFYRLKNYNNDWAKTESENLIYTNLMPGKYELEIYSVLSHSSQKSIIKKINIEVLPRFWQTLWFKIAIVFIVILIFVMGGYFVIRKRTAKIKQESSIKYKMAQMESKLLRSNMNPHFVFNSLNSIQSFITREEKDKATFYLSRFAKLMRNVLEQSANESIDLNWEIDMMTTYIELEQMRCNYSFDFSIYIESNINKNIIRIPGMLIQPYIENAIVHGLGPLQERRGVLTIDIKTISDKILYCTVIDNGIGRAEAKRIKEQKEAFHKSMGLSITSERLEYFKSQTNIDTKVVVTDIYNEENKNSGTKIEIHIPIINKDEI